MAERGQNASHPHPLPPVNGGLSSWTGTGGAGVGAPPRVAPSPGHGLRRGVATGAVLLGAVLLGLGAGLLAASPAPEVAMPDPLRESYIAVVAALYAQGEGLEVARGRLARLGLGEPASAARGLAESYAAHPDPQRRAQAAPLRLLAEALASGQEVPRPSLTRRSAVAPGTGEAPVPTALASPPWPRKGTARPQASAAIIRREPTTKSPRLGAIPYGARVDILGVESGEAAEPADNRWFQVDYQGVRGFVYARLIVSDQ